MVSAPAFTREIVRVLDKSPSTPAEEVVNDGGADDEEIEPEGDMRVSEIKAESDLSRGFFFYKDCCFLFFEKESLAE